MCAIMLFYNVVGIIATTLSLELLCQNLGYPVYNECFKVVVQSCAPVISTPILQGSGCGARRVQAIPGSLLHALG